MENQMVLKELTPANGYVCILEYADIKCYRSSYSKTIVGKSQLFPFLLARIS